jgi:Spy/CpxP family protein refolding chaperone
MRVQDQGVIMKKVLTIAVAIVAMFGVSDAFAQRGGPGGGGGFDILRQEEVRKELEIVDAQWESIQKIGEEIRGEAQKMFAGARDLSQEERSKFFENMREKFTEIRAKAEVKIKEELLPHQIKRLEQLSTQSRFSRGGTVRALDGELGEKLGITPEQLERLKAKSEEETKKLEEKTAELRAAARKAILSVLTPEQQKEIENMLGAPFNFPRPDFGRGNGGGGGRPGGDRGGRPGGDRPARPSET